MVPHAMKYKVELKPRAVKDLKQLNNADRLRILARIENLENNLAGDVKRLSHFIPAFRLRVGSYRILFEVIGDRVIVYRIVNRKDSYR
jgi:mRNA interferase RelE/StbE